MRDLLATVARYRAGGQSTKRYRTPGPTVRRVTRRPLDETVTIGDLADAVDIDQLRGMLGTTTRRREPVARSYAQVIAGRKGFPDPIVDRRNIRLWLRSEVESWLDRNRPGWRGEG